MKHNTLQYTSDSDLNKGERNVETFFDKVRIRGTYLNFFVNLCESLFIFDNLPLTISNDFLNRLLIEYGNIAIVETDDGLIATPYNNTKRYNVKGEPTEIQIVTAPNTDTTHNGKIITDTNKFVILKLNPNGVGLANTIMYFADKIAENQRAIDQNVFSAQTPMILEMTENQEKTVTEVLSQFKKMVRYIIFKRDRGARAEDMVKVLPTPPINVDKFITAIQYYESELYTFCGFKHTPFEKRERLLASEVASNNEVLNTTKGMMLRSLQRGIDEVNKKFKTDITVDFTLTNYNSNFEVVPYQEKSSSDIVQSEITEEGVIDE